MILQDTIFALSSGAPPAAIAVIRISGAEAGNAIKALARTLPQPRVASLRRLRAGDGSPLDQALILWMPGPATATGEHLAELHLHGGRAVINAVEAALAALPGLRAAQAGEFTRRAFANGRIDLAEAEGLADLLAAETELQRRQALAMTEGMFSAQVHGWRDKVLAASAAVEAMLDFGDEDDVGMVPVDHRQGLRELGDELARMLDAPRAELLRTGFQVVLSGPPNSGKSSLFNYLLGEDAAITAPLAGTTRDTLHRSVALEGLPFVFVDTAGLRAEGDDSIEAIGMARARRMVEEADLVLWLGPEGEGGGKLIWELESFADLNRACSKPDARHHVSPKTGKGIERLMKDLVELARSAMPGPGALALNKQQRARISEAQRSLAEASSASDLLITAEALRAARLAFDRLLGHAATEDMLDALFGRFCIGK